MSKLRHPSRRHRRPRPPRRLIRPGSSRASRVSDTIDEADDWPDDPGAPRCPRRRRSPPARRPPPPPGRRRSPPGAGGAAWSRRRGRGRPRPARSSAWSCVLVAAKGWLGDKVDDLAQERQEIVAETGIETGSTDIAHPPQRDIRLGTCEFDAEDGVQATGTLTNWTSDASDYRISLSFRAPSGTDGTQGAEFGSTVITVRASSPVPRRTGRPPRRCGPTAPTPAGSCASTGGARARSPPPTPVPEPGRRVSQLEEGPTDQTALVTPTFCRQHVHAGAVDRSEGGSRRTHLVGHGGSARRALRPHDGRLAHRLPRGRVHPDGPPPGRRLRPGGPAPTPAADRRLGRLLGGAWSSSPSATVSTPCRGAPTSGPPV